MRYRYEGPFRVIRRYDNNLDYEIALVEDPTITYTTHVQNLISITPQLPPLIEEERASPPSERVSPKPLSPQRQATTVGPERTPTPEPQSPGLIGRGLGPFRPELRGQHTRPQQGDLPLTSVKRRRQPEEDEENEYTDEEDVEEEERALLRDEREVTPEAPTTEPPTPLVIDVSGRTTFPPQERRQATRVPSASSSLSPSRRITRPISTIGQLAR